MNTEVEDLLAVAMVHGPRAGLAELDAPEDEVVGGRRLDAVRGHLLERAGG
jgi:predicted RNA polymerase sigma factor